jgi:hypothetical protein
MTGSKLIELNINLIFINREETFFQRVTAGSSYDPDDQLWQGATGRN